MELAESISDWKQSINAMYAVRMDYAKTDIQKNELWDARDKEIAEGAGAYYRKYGIK
jgi:hypothetical protein